jgi:4-amino-4-deoxy-L-arabinose transferase-like glycosyltransferase
MSSGRRFDRSAPPVSGGRRFSRPDNGVAGNGGNGGGTAVRVRPALSVAQAIEDLDAPTRALLDLSLRYGMDDHEIAAVGGTDVGTLQTTRREAIRLVTAGIDAPPETELEYVRRALALLYEEDPEEARLEVEPQGTVVAPPVTHPVDLDEIESILDLEPFELPELEPTPAPAPAKSEPTPLADRRARLLLLGICVVAAFLRLWQINKLGLNSDEAVYAGQGASIANDPTLEPFFPTFRAHPLLFQTFLSIGSHLGIIEIFGRVLSAMVGIATVCITFALGKLLYGRKAALLAALIMALMPYHVVVTRQILLDGPMVMFATLSLYLLVRYAVTERAAWLYAAGASMGLTAMSKETSLVLLGAVYAFLALTPELRVAPRRLIGSLAAMGAVLILFPLSLMLAGKSETGGNYLAWQLFRRPNHDWAFYPSQVPVAIGIGVVLAAAAGLWMLRKRSSWRETLLVAWIVVPVVFFELWPVKGFQYLLPIAPAVAILAARALAHWTPDGRLSLDRLRRDRRGALAVGAIAIVCLSLLVSTWGRIDQAGSATFLAGSGGVPGGREAGAWIRHNVPEGAQMLTVGPSMANIVQFYGHREAFGLSVSPNPLNRNPSYKPIDNPDLSIRSNELQYLVWDAFSASRSKFFSRSLQRYADRYHGRVVHTETVAGKTAGGKTTQVPVIRIYEVRP